MLMTILKPMLVVVAFGALFAATTVLYGIFNNKE